MRKLRVALVALHFAEYSVNLAKALASHVDVFLVLYRGNVLDELGEGWEGSLANSQLKVLLLDRPRNVAEVIKNSARLVSALKAFGPLVIHLQEDIRDELALTLALFTKTPKVLTVHDPAPHSGRDARRLRLSRLRLYRDWARHSSTAAITHGKTLADALVQQCPWLRGKVWAIAHGPLGLRDGPPTVSMPANMRLLFFGRIQQYKGLGNFVTVIAALRAEGLPVVGVVAGKGEDLDRHRDAMAKAGCFEILDRYIPSCEVATLFQQARAVILPYTDGTQSGVAALALGHGRPVVASAVGSIPELVLHGQNGLLVPPGDAHALKSAVRAILLDDHLWTTLAQGALALRDNKLSWNTIATQTLATYASVVS